MNRRGFLALAAGAVVAPAVPIPASPVMVEPAATNFTGTLHEYVAAVADAVTGAVLLYGPDVYAVRAVISDLLYHGDAFIARNGRCLDPLAVNLVLKLTAEGYEVDGYEYRPIGFGIDNAMHGATMGAKTANSVSTHDRIALQSNSGITYYLGLDQLTRITWNQKPRHFFGAPLQSPHFPPLQQTITRMNALLPEILIAIHA